MTIETARQAGQDAFENGRDRAPALNQAFLKACFAETNEGDTIAPLLDAYLAGWDRANLDAPLYEDEADYMGQNGCVA